MGEALIRMFPCIDIVVRGEGEHAAVEVCAAVRDGRSLTHIPDLCYRDEHGKIVVDSRKRAPVSMGEVPRPDYEEYFERLAGSGLERELRNELALPIETSRGCWWGEKAHCTFCGLNRDLMAFRSKEPDTVVADVLDLAARHNLLRFVVVDNIIDWRYVKSVLPRLREADYDWSFFYETKANLRREHIELYADAGIRIIQPGIESLSTAVLKLMRKGVTALQNIATLKWCAAYGIRVNWNIIAGTPREPTDEYARMAAVVPSLIHLEPPNLVKLALHRFAPYHQDPEAWGLTITGPRAFYEHIYRAAEAVLMDVAYSFEFTYDDGRDVNDYAQPLADAVHDWRMRALDSAGQLLYFRGPDFLRIKDYRRADRRQEVVLDAVESQVYLACEEGATVESAWLTLDREDRARMSQASVETLFDELVALRLMFAENGRYLGLALPTEPRDRARSADARTAARRGGNADAA